MIVVRDIFQLQFGKARDALDALQEGQKSLEARGYEVSRILVDVTGEYYTLVMESGYENLAAYESAYAEATQDSEWREAYSRFVPLVKSGRREIFRVVE